MSAQFRKIRLWLIPGMKVKRHISLTVLGIVFLMLGAVLFVWRSFQNDLSESIAQIFINPIWIYGGHYIALFLYF